MTASTTPDVEDSGPQGTSEESQKFFASHRRFTAHEPTGAFDNALTSFRLAPRPYYWREVALVVGVLYGTIVGLPVAVGVWAAWRIWREMHG